MSDSDSDFLYLIRPPAKRLRRDFDLSKNVNPVVDVSSENDDDESDARNEDSSGDESDAGSGDSSGSEGDVGHEDSSGDEGDSAGDGESRVSALMDGSRNNSSESRSSETIHTAENVMPMDVSDNEMLKFEDIKDITLRRSDLVSWLDNPVFEELIAGCFVRYLSGTSEHRLCRVKNVDATRKDRLYRLDGLTTYKYLNLIWGAEEATRLSMKYVSDFPPIEREFEEWVKAAKRTSDPLPSWQHLLDKKKSIQEIRNAFVAPLGNEFQPVNVLQAGVVATSATLEAGEDAGILVDTRALVNQCTQSTPLHTDGLTITLPGPSPRQTCHNLVTSQAQATPHIFNNSDSVYASMTDLLLTISELNSSAGSTAVAFVVGETNLQEALESFYDLAKRNLTDLVKEDTVEAMRKLLPTLTMCASSLTPEQSHSVEFLQLHFEDMVKQHKEFTDFHQKFEAFEGDFASSLEDLTKKQQEEDERQFKLLEIAGRERELEDELRRLGELRNNVIQGRISSSQSIGVSVLKVKEMLEKKPQMEISKKNSKKGLISLMKQWDIMRSSFL